jgi:hypothetical protein
MTIAILAALLTLGTVPVPGSTFYSWEVHYVDGQVVTLPNTTEPQVTFTPRPGRRFTLLACNDAGCSPPSYEVVADPLVGDTSPFDGAVGLTDFLALGMNFGKTAP